MRDEHGGARIIAYYAGWAALGDRPYRVADIPADRLTHVNYAFANLSATTGEISLGEEDAGADAPRTRQDAVNLEELAELRRRHEHLRTLISVGGWTWSGSFSAAALSDESRQRFARSCAAFAARYGMDGVDIDWEYPASDGAQKGDPRDTRHFTLLLEALRRALDEQSERDGRAYLLTIAAPAGEAKIGVLEVERIAGLLDFINVMTYDFAGAWSPVTYFNAPLHATTSSLRPLDDVSRTSHADGALAAFLDRGAPAHKLVLGVPFYGRSWRGVPPDNDGLFQPHEGDGRVRARYRDLLANDLYGMRRCWHPEAGVPWLYDAEKRLMVTYDDPQSIRLKGEYTRQRGLGGAMFWELTGDDGRHSLLRALTAGLTGDTGAAGAER